MNAKLGREMVVENQEKYIVKYVNATNYVKVISKFLEKSIEKTSMGKLLELLLFNFVGTEYTCVGLKAE